MAVIERTRRDKKSILDWILRLIKGVVIGIGAIVPGLSGGVFAVIFGYYRPLIHFLGNLKDNFLRNLFFFLPVVSGILLGGILFSAVVDFAFSHYASEFTWLFVGFITGTVPSLYKTAGEKGRRTRHWLGLAGAIGATLLFMLWIKQTNSIQVERSFLNWTISGALVGLGVVLPGMSPSNFLIYMGLYQPMAHGISHFELSVLIPLTIGLVIVIFAFARIVSWLFRSAYTLMYHLTLGVVIGSTLAILPLDIRGAQILVCIVLFTVGLGISYLVAKLDEKYPHELVI